MIYELFQWALALLSVTLFTVQQVSIEVFNTLGLFDQAVVIQKVADLVLHEDPNRPDIIRQTMLAIMDIQSQHGTPSGSLP